MWHCSTNLCILACRKMCRVITSRLVIGLSSGTTYYALEKVKVTNKWEDCHVNSSMQRNVSGSLIILNLVRYLFPRIGYWTLTFSKCYLYLTISIMIFDERRHSANDCFSQGNWVGMTRIVLFFKSTVPSDSAEIVFGACIVNRCLNNRFIGSAIMFCVLFC